MRCWTLSEIETPDGARSPVVLHSQEGERRVVLIELRPGEALGDHQVKESALVLVVEGAARVEAGDEPIDAATGTLIRFEPDEEHSITSVDGARILLLLAPWPGEGHYRGDPAEWPGVSAS